MRHLIKSLGLTLLLAAFLACPVGFASAQSVSAPSSEEISSFSVEMWVQPDGYVDVTETISYYFPSPRHGIYRDLPLMYQDGDTGKTFTRPLSRVSVDGH
jgi:hypothetical protein